MQFVGMEEISKSQSVRLLYLRSPMKEVRTYVIKVPYVGCMEKSEEWIGLLKNEIRIQSILQQLGFRTKRFLLVELDSKCPDSCFVISDYIPGVVLEQVEIDNLVKISSTLLGYLYRLHSSTLAEKYGFLNARKDRGLVGTLETKFLKADMARDGILLGAEASKGFNAAINVLNRQKQFCLCHCDVTLRNVIWDGNHPYLIDWAFARFTHPAHDVAHVLFWLMEAGHWDVAFEKYKSVEKRYLSLGFSMDDIMPFYLGQRYIEFGRIRGKEYIQRGLKMLAVVGSPINFKKFLSDSH
jgi:hypothetical protein